jgi:hypothetical protein
VKGDRRRRIEGEETMRMPWRDIEWEGTGNGEGTVEKISAVAVEEKELVA